MPTSIRQDRQLLVALLAMLALPQLASGQVLSSILHPQPGPNAACGLQACPPKATTYGYYLESWRRWPAEYDGLDLQPAPPADQPRREIPPAIVPPPREEASTTQTDRQPISGGAAPRTTQPAPTRSQPAQQEPDAATDVFPMPDEAMPEEDAFQLPFDNDTSEPATPDSEFQLPDISPQPQQPAPQQTPEQTPAEPGDDDLFDLEGLDLGQHREGTPQLDRRQTAAAMLAYARRDRRKWLDDDPLELSRPRGGRPRAVAVIDYDPRQDEYPVMEPEAFERHVSESSGRPRPAMAVLEYADTDAAEYREDEQRAHLQQLRLHAARRHARSPRRRVAVVEYIPDEEALYAEEVPAWQATEASRALATEAMTQDREQEEGSESFSQLRVRDNPLRSSSSASRAPQPAPRVVSRPKRPAAVAPIAFVEPSRQARVEPDTTTRARSESSGRDNPLRD